MTNMFKPKMPAMPAGAGQPLEIPKPRPIRMPFEGDESLVEASRRTRASALKRRGRSSTIMTDGIKETTGSSGQSLGA